jgi:hypothetical protein
MEQQNAEATISTRSVGIRYGFILGVVVIGYFSLINFLKLSAVTGFWLWFKYIFITATIYLAHRTFKKANSRRLDFRQGVLIAVWVGLVFGLIDGVFRYIYIEYIDASFLSGVRAEQVEDMRKDGMSELEIKQASSITSLIVNSEVIAFVVFISGLVGSIVIGLVLSIFSQTRVSR